jgi:hypothetical protein
MLKGCGIEATRALKAASHTSSPRDRNELRLLKFPILADSWLILVRANQRKIQLPYTCALCTFQFQELPFVYMSSKVKPK